MKIRKLAVLFLLICILAVLILPAAATQAVPAGETPDDSAQEAAPDEPAQEEVPAAAANQEGFSVRQFAAPGEIFTTAPRAAILIELNTDTVLYELDADEKNYPASLTKIMTCLLALEYGNLDDILTVREENLQNLHESGSTSGLLPGEQMRLEDMLYCLMLESANESCNVIAEYISGSVEAFVELMNQTARDLGCTGTHFVNPHGLHDEEHYTTARDMAKITMKALENETFRTITGSASYDLPATNLQEGRTIHTTNRLMLNTAASGFYYSKASGIKTGFHTPAQCCLASTADNGNLRQLVIILGAPLVWNEDAGIYIYRNFPEAINLFEYGFNHFSISTVMSTLYPVAEVQVNQSAGAQTVALAPVQEVRTLIDKDFDPDEVVLDVSLPNKTVDAPVEAGQILGSVTVTYHGMILGRSDLAAITTISRSEITHRADSTKAYVETNWWKWLFGILLTGAGLVVAYILVMQLLRRRNRRRKVAARRRALELQKRKQRLRDFHIDD